MARPVGLMTLAIVLAACSAGGEDSGSGPAPIPQPPTSNAPVVATSQVEAFVGLALDTRLSVSDPNGDSVTISVESGPSWLDIAEDGALSGTPQLTDRGAHTLVITASDGTHNTEASIAVQVSFDAIEAALETGDYTLITDESEEDIETVLLDLKDPSLKQHREDIAYLYQLGPGGEFEENSLAPTWVPPRLDLIPDVDQQAVSLTPNTDRNAPAMLLNDGRPFAVKGRNEHGARHFVFGGNPTLNSGDYKDFSETDHMDLFLRNALYWTAQKEKGDALNIAITRAPDYWSRPPDANIGVRQWLDGAFGKNVTYNLNVCQANFTNCLTDDADLIIIFRHSYLLSYKRSESYTAITDAYKNGVGIVYFFNEAIPTSYNDSMRRMLSVGSGALLNRKEGHKVEGEDSVHAVYEYGQTGIPVIKSMVSRIAANDFEYDFSACEGPLACQQVPEIAAEIKALREAVDTVLIDVRGTDPFTGETATRFQRGLLLIGDYYRAQTKYPMPTSSTGAAEIFAAILGEFAIVLQRESTPAQSDLGTHITQLAPVNEPQDDSLSLKSRIGITASGLYAFPGEPVTITRTDEDNARVWVQVHAQDPSHYKPFETINGTGYERPVHITSEQVELVKDNTVTITSPYGGPIQIASNLADRDLAFTVTNAGRHPIWQSEGDDESFLIELAAHATGWSEIVTPNYVVHASIEKMREALNTPPYVNNPGQLAHDYNAYLGNWPLWFEGFQGQGITENPGLQTHAIAKQYLPKIDAVRHLIAGPTLCTTSCPGSIQHIEGIMAPLARENQDIVAGEMHALLTPTSERDSTPARSFGPQDSLSALSYIHSNYRRYQEVGSLAETCPELPYKDIYVFIQAAQATTDPAAAIREQTAFSESQFNTVRYAQLTAAMQAQGVFRDGWEIWPLINLYERRYARNGRYWISKLQKIPYEIVSDGRQLGYGNRQAEDVYQNTKFDDWMLVALSWATRRDLTDYVTELWGLQTTEYARDIVAGYNFERLEPRYYALSPTGHCTDLNAPELAIDGTTNWPN